MATVAAAANEGFEFRVLDFQVVNAAPEDVELPTVPARRAFHFGERRWLDGFECTEADMSPCALDNDDGWDEDDVDDDDDEFADYQPKKVVRLAEKFYVRMFGVNERGEVHSVLVKSFRPFFYIKVFPGWNAHHRRVLESHLRKTLGDRTFREITKMELVEREKMRGFNGGHKHPFLLLEFANLNTFHRVKSLWYTSDRRLLPGGMPLRIGYKTELLELYESQIPPLLRFFHVSSLSPTGWVRLPADKVRVVQHKTTNSHFQLEVHFADMVPLNDKETAVPFKIMSFDIEANSSHGDFPVPVKTYKKLAGNIMEDLENWTRPVTEDGVRDMLNRDILNAFNFDRERNEINHIDLVYPKVKWDYKTVNKRIKDWMVDSTYTDYHLLAQQEVLCAPPPPPLPTPSAPTAKQEPSASSASHSSSQAVGGSNGSSTVVGIDPEDERMKQAAALARTMRNLHVEESFEQMRIFYEKEDDVEDGGDGDNDGDGDSHEPSQDIRDMGIEVGVGKGGLGKRSRQSTTLIHPRQLRTTNTSHGHYGGGRGYRNVAHMLMDEELAREDKVNALNRGLVRCFPELEGDKVTFIGSTFTFYGQHNPHLNHCIVLNTCAPVNSPLGEACPTVIESYQTEREVLLAWQQLVQRENPDIIIGYNIFNFDYQFMYHRAAENGCLEDFLKLSRNAGEVCAKKDKAGVWQIEQSSVILASGQHDNYHIKMPGRQQIDLHGHYRRNLNLPSYKLDFVAGHHIGDGIKQCTYDAAQNVTRCKTHKLTGLLPGSFVHFEEIGFSTDYYQDGAKFEVLQIDPAAETIVVRGHVAPDIATKKVRWGLAKDDVTPKEIFELSNGTAEDRAIIAKYCLQDCNLLHYLMIDSDVLTGFVEMASICSVPIDFLVFRGQGIKLLSFLAKKCRERGMLMPVLDKAEGDDGYEGAIVLEPKTGVYLDKPVACVDFASLYPSSMISENLSHDTKVWTREYDLQGRLRDTWGECDAEGRFVYDNLPGYEYVDVIYDTYKYVRKNAKSKAEKVKDGYKVCRFVQPRDGKKGVLPSVLCELLDARKRTRALAKKQSEPFMMAVLEQRQLAYKQTANSLYGGAGARTSAFYEKDIAACTTATGRKLLTYAKRVIEECYRDRVCETKNHGRVRTNAEYIYGDTDSVFFTLNLRELDGQPIRGVKALELTIELAQEAGHLASMFLKQPHDLEYEKTFTPFILLSKKRYVGMLYELDIRYGKRKEMGIVLKRRDNAPIVKDVYGGIIDILMKQQNVAAAVDFLKRSLVQLTNGTCPVDKLVITKSLRSGYKNPKQIAHKVLADRMTQRDPGNKPSSGDRIPFVYIVAENAKLQGDKIETPAFVAEHKLRIDYAHYITNQIMKPVLQLLALVLEDVWAMHANHVRSQFQRQVQQAQQQWAEDAARLRERVAELRAKEVKRLLFDSELRRLEQQKKGQSQLCMYIGLH